MEHSIHDDIPEEPGTGPEAKMYPALNPPSIGSFRWLAVTLLLAFISPVMFALTGLVLAAEQGGKRPDEHSTLSSGRIVHSPVHTCRIVNSFPHDPDAFTQGFLYFDGFLYESTGLYGRSSVRQVELRTGKVLKNHQLAPALFGEGLTLWKDNLVQITWKSGVGFVRDRDSFELKREFSYQGEGWGLTTLGDSLVMSDGSSELKILDPEDFSETGRIVVRENGTPINRLNELELVKGEILANIYMEDVVVRISPTSGAVLGWIDLGSIRQSLGPVRNAEVLNGIAFDSAGGRLFVTGKFWPRVFEIELVQASEKK